MRGGLAFLSDSSHATSCCLRSRPTKYILPPRRTLRRPRSAHPLPTHVRPVSLPRRDLSSEPAGVLPPRPTPVRQAGIYQLAIAVLPVSPLIMANGQDQAPPSLAAVAVASALIAGVVGYYVGQGQSLGLFGRADARASASAQHSGNDHKDSDSDMSDLGSADEDDDMQDLGELQTFPGNREECKLVLVVRTDLGMSKGKIAAQCGHAVLACYKAMLRADPSHPLLQRWEHLGQAKVALKVDSEEDMLMLQATAVSLGLCAQVIHDAGRTQIASGSATVLGVGPAPKSKIDQVTGHLRLL
nr:putative peptidyl-trna hydrolase 2 [Quercus suber]